MRIRRWALVVLAVLAGWLWVARAEASDCFVNRPGCCVTEPIDCNEKTSSCNCSFVCGPKVKTCDCTCEEVASPTGPPTPSPQPKPTALSVQASTSQSIHPGDTAGISLHGQPLRVAEFANYLRTKWKVEVIVSEDVAGTMLPDNWEMSGPLEAVLARLGHTAGIHIHTDPRPDSVAIVFEE